MFACLCSSSSPISQLSFHLFLSTVYHWTQASYQFEFLTLLEFIWAVNCHKYFHAANYHQFQFASVIIECLTFISNITQTHQKHDNNYNKQKKTEFKGWEKNRKSVCDSTTVWALIIVTHRLVMLFERNREKRKHTYIFTMFKHTARLWNTQEYICGHTCNRDKLSGLTLGVKMLLNYNKKKKKSQPQVTA